MQNVAGVASCLRGGPAMNKKNKFVLIVCAVVVVSSLSSHTAISWLRIRAAWGNHKEFAPTEFTTTALLHSSSPGYDAIDWAQISKMFGESIQGWATPGSSPSEWEVMHSRASESSRVFVAVSPYDLNEFFLCDFRADIVPLTQTIRDLSEARADWPFT